MFFSVLHHSSFRKELILQLYRQLLKRNAVFPDQVVKEYYQKLFRAEFKKLINIIFINIRIF